MNELPRVAPDRPCLSCGTQNSTPAMECTNCGLPLIAGALPHSTIVHNKYRIEGVLGRGGFAITYRAIDLTLQRPVALKELFPAGSERRTQTIIPAEIGLNFADLRERFHREARTLAPFDHPGIVRVNEVFDANDTTYVVMELLDGPTLAAVMASGPLPVGAALDAFVRIAHALAPVHDHGLLHRDLKPANVVMHPVRGPVLIDFGAARVAAAQHSTLLTKILTPMYAAPEQYSSTGNVGPYTDMYGWGASLHHAICGIAPPPATERLLGADTYQPASAIRPDVPRPLSDLISRCLALNPKARPQSIAELVSALSQTQPTPAIPTIISPLPTLGAQPAPAPFVPPHQTPAAASGASWASGSTTEPAGEPTAGRWTPPPPVIAPQQQYVSAAPPTTYTPIPLTAPIPPPAQPVRKSRAGVAAAAIAGVLALGSGGIFLATRGGDSKKRIIVTIDTTTPDSTAPDSTVSDTIAPDTTGATDTTAVTDTTGGTDTTIDPLFPPDTARVPDTRVPDTAPADTRTPDTSAPDTTLLTGGVSAEDLTCTDPAIGVVTDGDADTQNFVFQSAKVALDAWNTEHPKCQARLITRTITKAGGWAPLFDDSSLIGVVAYSDDLDTKITSDLCRRGYPLLVSDLLWDTEDNGCTTFLARPTREQIGSAMADLARTQGRQVVILRQSDYAPKYFDAVKTRLGTDFSTIDVPVSGVLAAAAVRSVAKADVIISIQGDEGAKTLTKLRGAGVALPVVLSDLTRANALQDSGTDLAGVTWVSDAITNDDFNRRYKAAYGDNNDYFGARTININDNVTNLLTHLGRAQTPREIVDSLRRLSTSAEKQNGSDDYNPDGSLESPVIFVNEGQGNQLVFKERFVRQP